jgi:hypothetical protein
MGLRARGAAVLGVPACLLRGSAQARAAGINSGDSAWMLLGYSLAVADGLPWTGLDEVLHGESIA